MMLNGALPFPFFSFSQKLWSNCDKTCMKTMYFMPHSLYMYYFLYVFSLYVLHSVCSTFYITFWLADFDWLPDAQPSTLSVSLEGKGKNEMEKVMGLRQRKGYHLAITITDKTDLTPFQGKSYGFDVYYWFSFHLRISEEVGTKAVLA